MRKMPLPFFISLIAAVPLFIGAICQSFVLVIPAALVELWFLYRIFEQYLPDMTRKAEQQIAAQPSDEG